MPILNVETTEENDYEKYLHALRRNPEAIILVSNSGEFRTFENDANLISVKLNKRLVVIDSVKTVILTQSDVDKILNDEHTIYIVEND